MEELSKDKSKNEDHPTDLNVANERQKAALESETKLKSDTELVKCNATENIVPECTSAAIIENVEPHLEKSIGIQVVTEICKESLNVSEKTTCPKLVEASQEPNITIEISESLMELDEKPETDCSNLTNESLLASISYNSAKSMETIETTERTDHRLDQGIENEEKMDKPEKPNTDSNITTVDSVKVKELEQEIENEEEMDKLDKLKKPNTDSNISTADSDDSEKVETFEQEIENDDEMDKLQKPNTDSNIRTADSEKVEEYEREIENDEDMDKLEKPNTDSNIQTADSEKVEEFEREIENEEEMDKVEKPNTDSNISTAHSEKVEACDRDIEHKEEMDKLEKPNTDSNIPTADSEKVEEFERDIENEEEMDKLEKSNTDSNIPTADSEKVKELEHERENEEETDKTEKPNTDSNILSDDSEKVETFEKVIENEEEMDKLEKPNTDCNIPSAVSETFEVFEQEIENEKEMDKLEKPNTDSNILSDGSEKIEAFEKEIENEEKMDKLEKPNSDSNISTADSEKVEESEQEIENEEDMDKLEKQNTDSNILSDDSVKVQAFEKEIENEEEMNQLEKPDDLDNSDDGSQKIKLIFDEPDDDSNCETRSFKENVMVKISGDIISDGKLDDPELLGDLGSPDLEEDLDLDAEMSESEILDSIEDVIGRSNTIKNSESEKVSISTESEKIQSDLEPQSRLAECQTSNNQNENEELKMDTKSDDTKNHQSNEKDESNITKLCNIISVVSASKSITDSLILTTKSETLASKEQKVDSEPEKPKFAEVEISLSSSRLADPDDLVEVEDALGLLAVAQPREEEEDENVGDDEDYEDDLEDDEGLEDSHHGGADSSEVESSTHQTEDDADGLQYECGDSQYYTETEQSMENLGSIDQDNEILDFESSSGMGFIQSVSTVSVPIDEFKGTKDEEQIIKKNINMYTLDKDQNSESIPKRGKTLGQVEESRRMDERDSGKMLLGSVKSEVFAGETDCEIDIGEEMLILEGKVISSEEFFRTAASEIDDISEEEMLQTKIKVEKEKEVVESKDLMFKIKDVVPKDEQVQEEMDVDIATEVTADHEEDIIDKEVENALLDSSGNEDTEMVPLEEKIESTLETIPEKPTQLEKETLVCQKRTDDTDDKSKELTPVTLGIKEIPEILGRQEGNAASGDVQKNMNASKFADLSEKENGEVVYDKLESNKKDNVIIEAGISDEAKLTEAPGTKIVSNKLDENLVVPVNQEDRLQKSDSDTALVEPKDGDGDFRVVTIVEKTADATANEAVVPSGLVPSVSSTPEKRKTKVLGLSNQENVTVVDIVDLEESSSDSDDILVVPTFTKEKVTPLEEEQKEKSTSSIATVVETKEKDQSKTHEQPEVTDVDKEAKKTEGEKKIDKEERKRKFEEASKKSGYAISKEAIPMPAPPIAGILTEEKLKDDAMVTSGEKPAKSTVHVSEGEEVFNLDSDNDFPDFDDDDGIIAPISKDTARKMTAIDLQKVKAAGKCVNYACASSPDTAHYRLAPMFVLSHYREARTKRYKQYVCQQCLDEVAKKMETLVEGVRLRKPLRLHDDIPDVVLISDSDDDEDMEDALESTGEKLSEHNIKFLEEHLAEMINSTWKKYELEEQVRKCEEDIKMQLAKLEKECMEVDKLFDDVQRTTDMIRNDLYDSFAGDRHELPELEIMDTDMARPDTVEAGSVGRKSSRDDDEWTPNKEPASERRLSDVSTDTEMRRSTRKRKSIPNYSLMEEDGLPVADKTPVSAAIHAPDGKRVLRKSIENADITLVESARESAPAGLPPPGELVRAELQVGDLVYAVRQSTFGAWLQARVLEVWPKGTELSSGNPCLFTICKVRFEHKLKGTAVKQLTGRQLAYPEPANVRLPIGTRVIAIFKDPGNNYKKESYYSGVVAEMPNPVNSYRYLVFFDDGYAQYVTHALTLAVCECSARVWEDVHPDSRDFVRKYLAAYPERPMVRLQPGQALKTEWSGKWWVSHVLAVDASLVQVRFDVDGRAEWIYRGSTRLAPLFLELQAAERHRPRGLTRTTKSNMPYVEYTRLDHGDTEVIDMTGGDNEKVVTATKQQQQQQEVTQKRQELSTAAQRSVAKKSVSVTPPPPVPTAASYPLPDNVLSRVVYYSPKAAVKPHKMTAHPCSSACRRSDVLPLRELRTYNPLVRPLLVGWERMIHRFKGKKVVLYRAPCGRRLRDLPELHRYLRAVQSDMPVDLFDFHPEVHCLAEFVLGKCYVSKKDLSHGMESIPVPCVNYYDASLPEFCTYSTARTPTDGVPLNLDPDFLCGCDCTDDCQDKSKCQCWKLTLAGARTIGLEGDQVGYHYKRLPEPLPSGIYECNSRCKCAMTCLNRVVQHPLQLKLQVFKTSNRGWGIRTLNDVPRGAFLCVYAGNLLTDATANREGVTEGDEYLAELDYIEVVERMKEGYESDVPDDDKSLDRKPIHLMLQPLEEDEESEEEVETRRRRGDEEDVDFRPEFYVGNRTSEIGMRLRKRAQKEKSDQDSDSAVETAADREKEKEKTRNIDPDDHFITISDDEEVREPSSFAAQAGLEDDEYVSKHRSVRTCFGKDEACYIMDAKVQGNLGRYLNHSCCPNVFVQNVFVDTHDPRFPWVAFFSLTHVPAGTELTWNYNYDVGSVPNKVLYCACGAPNCRGRLL